MATKTVRPTDKLFDIRRQNAISYFDDIVKSPLSEEDRSALLATEIQCALAHVRGDVVRRQLWRSRIENEFKAKFCNKYKHNPLFKGSLDDDTYSAIVVNVQFERDSSVFKGNKPQSGRVVLVDQYSGFRWDFVLIGHEDKGVLSWYTRYTFDSQSKLVKTLNALKLSIPFFKDTVIGRECRLVIENKLNPKTGKYTPEINNIMAAKPKPGSKGKTTVLNNNPNTGKAPCQQSFNFPR